MLSRKQNQVTHEYNKGYDDAIGGFSYYVDPDHTDTYRSGYQNGYRDGIDKLHSFDANTPGVSRNSGSQTLGQNSEIKINGDNNNVKVIQSQAGSQDINSRSTTTIHDPRTHFYTPQQKQAIENALIP